MGKRAPTVRPGAKLLLYNSKIGEVIRKRQYTYYSKMAEWLVRDEDGKDYILNTKQVTISISNYQYKLKYRK